MLCYLLHAKLCHFVFGTTLLVYVAAVLVASFWEFQASVAEW